MSPEFSVLSVSERFLLEKCDYFVDVQLWPLQSTMDPRGWLSNFLPSEREHALSLLNAFTYFSSVLIDEIFVAGFQNLCGRIVNPDESFDAVSESWRKFVETVIVTHVEGEKPNISDSGYSFARRARQLLRIRQDQIMPPDEALRTLLLAPSRGVVFVDDFVGTGRQFLATWNRQRAISNTRFSSFAELTTKYDNFHIFYIPLFSTASGMGNIVSKSQGALVLPTHILSERYGAFSSSSYLWPPHLQSSATEFLHAASRRAGVGDDWKGLDGLGLAVAFDRSVPDSTLPIIYWEDNGWKPLIRRT